jgi:hypothetical protein
MRRRSFSSEASSIEDEISFANDVSRHSSAGDHDDSKSISTFFTETLDLQSQPWSVDENQDIVGSLVDDDIDYSAFSSSFMDMKFMSPVTNNIIETQKSLEVVAKSAVPSSYEPTAVFPCSVLSSDSWNDAKFAKDAVIQGILKISHESRSPKQV